MWWSRFSPVTWGMALVQQWRRGHSVCWQLQVAPKKGCCSCKHRWGCDFRWTSRRVPLLSSDKASLLKAPCCTRYCLHQVPEDDEDDDADSSIFFLDTTLGLNCLKTVHRCVQFVRCFESLTERRSCHFHVGLFAPTSRVWLPFHRKPWRPAGQHAARCRPTAQFRWINMIQYDTTWYNDYDIIRPYSS